LLNCCPRNLAGLLSTDVYDSGLSEKTAQSLLLQTDVPDRTDNSWFVLLNGCDTYEDTLC
jgi:hypothetical protein